ncbi:MAG TPA: tetratricopeptide repeat protein [Bryobacteraceae bacterium]|jgi:tetratricopeptide (TPR) repeat protein|nr:tetratricopeptide repeat protein [Bryobacteraceae bacterium]
MQGISTLRLAATGMVIALAVFSAGCNKLKARDNLNKGVNAFKAGQYTAAADDFKTAIDLDPDLPSARLYLATAYMTQYVPGSEAPDNKRNADSALQQFQSALNANLDDKNKLLAMQSLASLYYNMRDFPKSEEWHKKVIQADPKNKESYYSLGVIAWTEFVPADREARSTQGMRAEDPGPLKDPKKKEPDIKADLKAKYWQKLTDGIEDEKKALEIDPEYENAMAYMNLLIRYRADLDDTKEQFLADSKQADDWVQKDLETTKKKAQKKAAAAEQTQ